MNQKRLRIRKFQEKKFMKMYKSSMRRSTQLLFFAIVIFIGFKFYLFVSYLEKGILPGFDRPPGVEAFLPISALVSLKHWIYTGTINAIHPSALVLFLIICSTALIAKKGFCSWVCPIGFLSDGAAKVNKILFKRPLRLPKAIDAFLRASKYLIAGFFIYQIFYKMPAGSIEQFIQSSYNQFADIKMLKFFTDMSKTAFIVILVLIGLSILIRHFWCRYLCPYGALLGVIGFLSLGKIHREPSTCTGCGKCETACPGSIAIRQKRQINSPECSSCLTCIQSCPEKSVLKFKLLCSRQPLSAFAMAVFFVLIFTSGITIARVSGHWQNDISPEAYLRYTAPTASPSIDQIRPEKMQRMILMMRQLREQQMLMENSQSTEEKKNDDSR